MLLVKVPVVLLLVLSETEVVAYLGHSSLNPELSQFIVPKLIWPSSDTFQHHQLSTSEDTASCLLGRLDTHQRASLCGQLEFVSRTSLIGFESRLFSATRPSGVFVERPRSLEQQQSASICGGLPAWEKKKSELSQLNDGTATVRVSHYTTVHYGLNESRVCNFQ